MMPCFVDLSETCMVPLATPCELLAQWWWGARRTWSTGFSTCSATSSAAATSTRPPSPTACLPSWTHAAGSSALLPGVFPQRMGVSPLWTLCPALFTPLPSPLTPATATFVEAAPVPYILTAPKVRRWSRSARRGWSAWSGRVWRESPVLVRARE